MRILEKFWKGEVAPGERCHISKGEYSKSYAAMVDSEEYLQKHLIGEDLQQFQQFRLNTLRCDLRQQFPAPMDCFCRFRLDLHT